MKIKIALIPSVYAAKAQELSVKLQNAMDSGDMYTVDQISVELLSLVDKDHSLDMSEENWYSLIKTIRGVYEDFKSECLMTPQQLKSLKELCLTKSFQTVGVIFDQALRTDSCVLQLPFESGGDHV